ncbi:MAG: hypothetical protein NZ928_06170 [Endomicrobia bacterium]|nr:hypothetical protein [Endomicrobiia bacterium]MDW8055218.1 hypothetical protein [Elusimicrobiota bacterium]
MSITFRTIRNKLISFIVYLFFFIFSKTPWKINIIIGAVLGKIFFYFDSRYKKIAFKNLKYIFPQYEHRQVVALAKECYTNIGKNVFEFFLFPTIKNKLNKIVKIEHKDLELLRQKLDQKKGLIIFSAHFGNWEILGAKLASLGIPLAVVARDMYIPELNQLIEKLRNIAGEIVIGRGGEQSVKKLMFALKKGYAIGVLIDQNIKNIKNIIIPFLGKDAATPVSFVEMVIKYNIPSVIGVIYRDKNDHHKIKIFPIEQELYSDKIRLMSYINQKISECILQQIPQWVWIHNRWNLI